MGTDQPGKKTSRQPHKHRWKEVYLRLASG